MATKKTEADILSMLGQIAKTLDRMEKDPKFARSEMKKFAKDQTASISPDKKASPPPSGAALDMIIAAKKIGGCETTSLISLLSLLKPDLDLEGTYKKFMAYERSQSVATKLKYEGVLFSVVVPLRKCEGHNYGVGEPTVIVIEDNGWRLGLGVGNHLPKKVDDIRIARPAEIERYFDALSDTEVQSLVECYAKGLFDMLARRRKEEGK